LKRVASIAALVALVFAPQALAGGGFHKTIASAQKIAKEKNRLIFVDLFAEWCGWCHRFDKEVVPSEAFQKATDDMVLLRLDTEDGKEGSDFSRRYGVTSLPTFVILTPDLAIAAILRGYAPPAQFAQIIDQNLEKYRAFETLVAQEQMLAKDYTKRLDIAREFRTRHGWSDAEKRFRKLTTEQGVPVRIRDEAYYDLGLLYLQQKKHAEVLKTVNDFGKVQKQGSAYERAKFLVPQVYAEQGNLKGAVEELRAFKAAFPKSELMPNVETALESLQRAIAQ
jgi:thioredoxin-related protein